MCVNRRYRGVERLGVSDCARGLRLMRRDSMNRSVRRVIAIPDLTVLAVTATLAGALAGNTMAQAPDTGCALPSEPEGIPAALDGAISGPADKDRACMKTLLIPEARMIFVSLGADGTPSYRLETVGARVAGVQPTH